MDTMSRLQRWYAAQCNGDWEHQYGVEVGTLDNPGWSVTVNVSETALEGKPFAEREHGLGDKATTDWFRLWVEDGRTFRGVGDPSKLDVILRAFLDWADA
jgi:hypothetical protein